MDAGQRNSMDSEWFSSETDSVYFGFGGDGLFWIILPEIKDPDERVYLRF